MSAEDSSNLDKKRGKQPTEHDTYSTDAAEVGKNTPKPKSSDEVVTEEDKK